MRTGPDFKTKQLIGLPVKVTSKNPNIRWTGKLLNFFESNGTIALKDFNTLKRNEEGNFEVIEEGKVLVIDGHSWVTISSKKSPR